MNIFKYYNFHIQKEIVPYSWQEFNSFLQIVCHQDMSMYKLCEYILDSCKIYLAEM